MDRCRWYLDQLVLDSEMNLAFDQVEEADRRLASDLGVFGIINGAVAVPHQPVADLSIDVTAPGRAYDRHGRRLFVGGPTTVDISIDASGAPTEVTVAGNERWVSVFLRFARVEYDPRTDGNSQVIHFRRDEAADVVVVQGPEGPLGSAPRPPIDVDMVLVCDVRRRPGQTAIVAGDIDTSRRQSFVLSAADAIGAQPGAWQTVHPAGPTVQAALDAVDDVLTGHVAGATHRHRADHVDIAPPAFLTQQNVQGVVTELVAALASSTAGAAGASRIGADGVPAAPAGLAAGTVDSQLQQLLGQHNAHLTAPTAAHEATAIRATPHAYIAAGSVQAQLEEIVSDLAIAAAGQAGARRVGVEPIAGTPLPIPTGNVQGSLGLLLAGLNAHLTQVTNAHAARAVQVADDNGRFAAENAETVLDEIMRGFEADHVRPRDSVGQAGWHRTIRQPQLSGDAYVPLWESRGAGLNSVFRVYATGLGVIFTVNAQRTTNEWNKDAASLESVAMVLERGTFQVWYHSGATPFVSWPKVWRLGLGGSSSASWEVMGQISDSGRVSCEGTNTATTGRNVSMGTSVNLRSRFLGPPSSITLLTIGGSNFQGNPLIDHIDRDGFTIRSTQFVAAGGHSRWVGRYTAVA